MTHQECPYLTRRFYFLLLVLCFGLLSIGCGHSTATFVSKGEEYLQKRKYHDALMQFRSAVESDKDSAPAHWGLARAHESLGQFNETLDELRKTVELDDKNIEAKAKLGSYFLLVQPPLIAEAVKVRDEILAQDPKFIEGHILSASILAVQGKPDAEVVNAVNKAIAMDPARIQSYISLERLYVTREKPQEAEATIQKGIAAAPSAVAGYVEYGRFLMYASRDNEADAQFQKAIAVDNNSIEAREAAAEFYVISGQLQKAETAYVDLVRIQENSPESRLVLAEFYAKAKRTTDAITALNEILVASPEYALARYRLTQIHIDRGEAAKASEQLDVLLAANDDDIEALLLRAKLKIHDNRPDEAVKDLEDVLKRTPSAREPLFLMVQAQLANGQLDRANAFLSDLTRYHPSYLKAGLLKIQSAFVAGDAAGAVRFSNELLQRANAATPSSDLSPEEIHEVRLRATSSRGLAYLEQGSLDNAKTDLSEIVRQSPKSAAAMVNLAKVYNAENNFAEALNQYQAALAVDKRSFDAANGAVNTLIRLKQTDKAHATMNDLFASAPDNSAAAALHYLNSNIFQAEKNLPKAEQELTTAIRLDENYLPAYSAYAGLLADNGRTDEALGQYNKVLEKRPSAQIFTMVGILEDARGRAADAETAYRKALELSPDSAIAANNLAWLLADNQGNLDEALQLATGAVAKNQTVAGYYDTLGWVYLKKGLGSPAVEQLKKAIALDEASSRKTGSGIDAGYRVRLAMALAKTGNKAAARREVEVSLQSVSSLTPREVSDAKGVLASL